MAAVVVAAAGNMFTTYARLIDSFRENCNKGNRGKVDRMKSVRVGRRSHRRVRRLRVYLSIRDDGEAGTLNIIFCDRTECAARMDHGLRFKWTPNHANVQIVVSFFKTENTLGCEKRMIKQILINVLYGHLGRSHDRTNYIRNTFISCIYWRVGEIKLFNILHKNVYVLLCIRRYAHVPNNNIILLAICSFGVTNTIYTNQTLNF